METTNLKLISNYPEARREPAAYERIADGFMDDWPEEAAKAFTAALVAVSAEPWVHGFSVIHQADQALIGSCAFKGPPDQNGVVEIAYVIAPGYQGRGYATEAVAAVVEHVLGVSKIRIIRAHTLPEANASARVLTKCGFQHIGEVTDPEDGLVWRWERGRSL